MYLGQKPLGDKGVHLKIIQQVKDSILSSWGSRTLELQPGYAWSALGVWTVV
jgi:hypothetical protein